MQVQKLGDKISGKRKQIRTANLSQTAKNTDYSAYTSLRSDLERLLALMEAMVIRSSTLDGRCSIKLSLLCESTVPVGEAPVQRQTPVRNTEYVCAHVCHDFDPRSANHDLVDTIARFTAIVLACAFTISSGAAAVGAGSGQVVELGWISILARAMTTDEDE